MSAQTTDARRIAPELVITEVALLGGMDPRPEYAFSTIRDLALLPTGHLAVADGASQEVRLFDRSGEHVATLGGRGDGPGEFRALRDLVVLPRGRLLVWDIQRRRITIFGSDRQVSETYLIDAGAADVFFPRFAAAFPDGRVLIRDQIHPITMKTERPSTRRDSISLIPFGASGPSESPWSFEGPERDFYNQDGTWGFDRPLFANDLTHAVIGDTLFVAHTDSAFVRRFVRSTELVPWRLWGRGRSAGGDDRDAERASRLAALDERTARPGLLAELGAVVTDMRAKERQRIERIRAHDRLPALTVLAASDDGRLWVQGFPDRIAGTVTWYKVSPDGQLSGKLTLPVGEDLMAMTDSWLAAVRTDDFGTESVVLYRVDDP